MRSKIISSAWEVTSEDIIRMAHEKEMDADGPWIPFHHLLGVGSMLASKQWAFHFPGEILGIDLDLYISVSQVKCRMV